jgi:hypothetical protein
MTDLLKEAIADAKAVRATALANAKLALEEAFTPRIQSMLASKLAEEMEEEEMEDETTVSEEEDMEVANEGEEETADDSTMTEEDMEELEEILRELEGEDEETMSEEEDMEMEEGEEEEMTEGYDEDEMTEGDDEEVDLEEVIRALREEDDMEMEDDDDDMEMEESFMFEDEDMEEEEPAAEPVAEGRKLKEAYKVIGFLRKQINEVNLLNAKLLFSNKLFRNYELSESQKLRVIENFDRASNMREVKLVYTTICESMQRNRKKAAKMNESVASAPTRSTKPAQKVLNEGSDLASRWKKLAGLK